MPDQWKVEDGAHTVVRSAISAARERLDSAESLPEVLYEAAPGPYATRVLEELEEAMAWLLWARRLVIDEAVQTRAIPLRDLANAAGVAVSTLQRWKATPLTTHEHDGSDTTGPGARSERRKGDY